MEPNNQDITLEEIREMDLVNYLSNIGYEPSKIRNNDFWYLSPFRGEKVPSFKINRKINRWYDYGMGKGGNLIDFAIIYQGCSIAEFIAGFRENGPIIARHQQAYPQELYQPENKLKIIENQSLRSDILMHYLQDRRISVSIADEYCREVKYAIGEKTYFGIGFPNNSGGFEIRTPYFKASSSPKDLTTRENQNQQIAVFEGFMDFLTFRTLHRDIDEKKMDFLVLNSVAFFERARPIMECHQNVSLYLDRDRTGMDVTRYALSLSNKYKDESNIYNNHKDLNDWAVNIGKIRVDTPGRRISK